MTTILVVDDEPSLVTLLAYNLEKAGFTVKTAVDGPSAMETLATNDIDLMLLDVMLPGKNGVEITRDLRAEKNTVPIIMITALDDEVDKILGLEIGADDYITKPFSPREVLARVRAVLRRYEIGATANEVVATGNVGHYGNIAIDFDKMVVTKDNEVVKLTPKEYELLAYLAERQDRVLDRETILHGVWGFEYAGPDTRMVDMHMSHLREKLENDSKRPELLKTVRGFGYRFESQPTIAGPDA